MVFDQLLLDPAPTDLIDRLREAVAAAGRLSKKAPKPLPEAEEQRLLAALPAADGAYRYEGNGKLRLGVAWWTDPVGRKHVRVTSRVGGDMYDYRYEADEDGEDARGDDTPALCRVFPGSLIVVEAEGDDAVPLVVCGCGAIGTPEAIAWMGETCGPCADARADGQTVPRPFVARSLGGGSAVMRATPDGRGLILPNTEERLAYLDLTTGEVTTSEPTKARGLIGIALAPDGESCLAGYWSNHLVRWNWRSNTLKRYGDPLSYSQFHVSPDNAHAVTGESSTLLRIDWADAKTPVQQVGNFPNTRHGGFTRDGSKWVALSEEHSFVEYDLATRRPRTLRADVFDDLEDVQDWQYEMLQVQYLDADHGWAVVAFDDPEHCTFGPARVGPVGMPGEWRDLPFDDGGMTDNNMPYLLGFTPGGEYALYTDEDGRLVFFPTEAEGETTYRLALPGTGNGPRGLTFSPDGRTLHAATADGGVNLVVSIPWRQVLAAAGPVR